MKIGLDVHGVIDRYPDLFKELSMKWVKEGHEVHIVTGSPFSEVVNITEDIPATHYYSIVDHHLLLGTDMILKENGWWMEGVEWDRSKGDYAKSIHLNLHFDDTLKYGLYFPQDYCTFIHVPKFGFESILKNLLDI